MDEFELIEHAFRRRVPFVQPTTILPGGDDASIHRLPADQDLAISTDTSVQGVHWPQDFSLEDAGRRAVNAALSDMAAMGAAPLWAWLGVMAVDSQAADRMGAGTAGALREAGLELAGGDVVRAPVNALSVTVGGTLPHDRAMRRDGAKPGDGLWICGRVGLASRGLELWLQGEREGGFVTAFRHVRPLVAEGARLLAMGVRCCIDVSDGLYADARHLATASGVAVHLNLAQVPGFRVLKKEVGEKEAVRHMLGGGEDYALLFAAPKRLGDELATMATVIGECRQGRGVHIHLHGRKVHPANPGYKHF